jgi:hypothetical protein
LLKKIDIVMLEYHFRSPQVLEDRLTANGFVGVFTKASTSTRRGTDRRDFTPSGTTEAHCSRHAILTGHDSQVAAVSDTRHSGRESVMPSRPFSIVESASAATRLDRAAGLSRSVSSLSPHHHRRGDHAARRTISRGASPFAAAPPSGCPDSA